MKFSFECDGTDGLVLIDKSYLEEFDDDMLYAFDVFLDYYGKTELVYDFPNESWENVRKRESAKLIEFCNSGKMVLFLLNKNEENCEIRFSNEKTNSDTFLDIASGELVLVNAGELIQCLLYPDLEMETIMELNVESGTYAIESKDIRKINCIKSTPSDSVFNNVIDLVKGS